MSNVTVIIDGVPRRTPSGTTLAVALLNLGIDRFRAAVGGAPRGPLCAMGSCFDCRLTVNGVPGVRACLEPVRDGMHVEVT